jgi:hypothetical protein
MLPLRDVHSSLRVLLLTGREATVAVHTSYAFAGASGRFDAPRTVRAKQTAEGWRVVSAAPGGRDRPPWEVVALRPSRSAHFLVLGAPVPGLLPTLEAGRRRLAAALPGVRPPQRLLVIVAADAAQARRLTRVISGVETLAAISDARVRESGPARRVVAIAGQRLLVVRPAYEGLDQAGRLRVVTHELTHAALAARTSGRTPAWLIEGVALYASGDDRAAEAARLLRGEPIAGVSAARSRIVRRALSLATLIGPESIARLSGAAQAAAYAAASAAAFAIADRYGRRGLLRLYDAFNAVDLPGRVTPALDDRAARRALGTSLPAIQRAMERYARAHARGF